MALLHNFEFTGPLGDLSFYKMKGVERTVVRTKGGASKERIKTHPNFDQTRRVNAEFGARGTVSGYIMRQHQPIKAWNNHLVVGALNARVFQFVKLDTERPKGRRAVLLSKNPRALEGFSLSSGVRFDAVVATPLYYTLSRDTRSARIDIPALVPGANLLLPHKQPVYSIVAALTLVPDFFFNEASGKYIPGADYSGFEKKYTTTPWYPSVKGSAPASLELALDIIPPDSHYVVMLSVGIRLGELQDGLEIRTVPHAGAAKVLGVR